MGYWASHGRSAKSTQRESGHSLLVRNKANLMSQSLESTLRQVVAAPTGPVSKLLEEVILCLSNIILELSMWTFRLFMSPVDWGRWSMVPCWAETYKRLAGREKENTDQCNWPLVQAGG